MLTLSIPARRDPIARGILLALIAGVAWLAIARPGIEPAQAQSNAQGIIILGQVTATPALPTPASELPAFALSVPTPTALGWLDQTLAAAADVGDQLATDQAAQLATEQAAAAAQAEADRASYLANVGAQAPHSPRGDVSEPPPYQSGPMEVSPGIVIDPNPAPPAAPAQPAIAVAVPAISQEQVAVIGERDSNGCAPGQVFYPRSGCHTPGSGGAQPGAVGEP